MCESDRVSVPSAGPRHVLVVMRHAAAAAGARTDAERRLTDAGYEEARAAGEWFAGHGVDPDAALVSAATRTRETWAALAAGAGYGLTPVFSDSLYVGGPDTCLDLVRVLPESVTSLIVVGHNPTMGSLAYLLGDGEGDARAERELAVGSFPTSAAAVFELDGEWAQLDEGTGRLIAFKGGAYERDRWT